MSLNSKNIMFQTDKEIAILVAAGLKNHVIKAVFSELKFGLIS
jgi:ABC-type lipoprotein release transport system permease subunit